MGHRRNEPYGLEDRRNVGPGGADDHRPQGRVGLSALPAAEAASHLVEDSAGPQVALRHVARNGQSPARRVHENRLLRRSPMRFYGVRPNIS